MFDNGKEIETSRYDSFVKIIPRQGEKARLIWSTPKINNSSGIFIWSRLRRLFCDNHMR
jgi:hypothetical protein